MSSAVAVADPSAPRTSARAALSVCHDAYEAGEDAARRACSELAAAPTFCFVFAAAGHDQAAVLAGVRSQVGDAQIAGCSGEGVISRGESVEDDRVVTVLAISSPSLRFEILARDDYGREPETCGRELAAMVRKSSLPDPFAIILLTDGLSGHCTHFLGALERDLPAGIQIVGGTAGDAMSFQRTYQYANQHVLSNGVVAVLIGGAGHARIAVSHGCVPLGLERTVTAADNGWLRAIDDRSAWSVLKEYLDGEPVDLNAEGIVHLCFGESLPPDRRQGYDQFIIRTPLKLDRASGALYFPGGGFETGARIRMTRRDADRIRESAEQCAHSLTGEPPAFVLQFDCAGRGRILFGDHAACEIIEPLQRVIGCSQAWVGVHTYGEIAPVGGRAYYHNYTVALCAIYDGKS